MRLDGDVRMEEDTTSVVLVGCVAAQLHCILTLTYLYMSMYVHPS